MVFCVGSLSVRAGGVLFKTRTNHLEWLEKWVHESQSAFITGALPKSPRSALHGPGQELVAPAAFVVPVAKPAQLSAVCDPVQLGSRLSFKSPEATPVQKNSDYSSFNNLEFWGIPEAPPPGNLRYRSRGVTGEGGSNRPP